MNIHDNVFDLIQEIAEPTGPVLSWKAQVHIKQFLIHEENLPPEVYRDCGTKIAAKLKHCKLFMEDVQADQIVYDLERVESETDLNEQLAAVYDICDRERIWCR